MPRFSLITMIALLLALGSSGCTMLPVAKSRHESPWENFEQAKEVFDRITPYQTTREELRAMRIDPMQTPNIQILSYVDIIKMFMPNSSITIANLEPGLRECVEAASKCQALQVNLQRITSERHGNVLLDLFRFKRQSHQTGWQFSAVVVMVKDTVVYKIWGGTPQINEHIYRKNPLGPLQEPADVARDAALVGTM